MNSNFSLSNGSDSCLYNHIGGITHVSTHEGRRIQIRTGAATSPRIAMYVVLTHCATKASPKKGSSNSTIIGLRPSQYTPFIEVLFIFLLTNSINYSGKNYNS